LKSLKLIGRIDEEKWSMLLTCVEYALVYQKEHGEAPIAYLDEVGRASLMKYDWSVSGVLVETFLDFAVHFNLVEYVKAKAETADKNVLQHATKFNHGVVIDFWHGLDPDLVQSTRDELSMALDHALVKQKRGKAKKWFLWRRDKTSKAV
jgi:hypothetical protein